MLRIALFALFAGLLMTIPSAYAAGVPESLCLTRAAASVDALVKGDYAVAGRDFDPLLQSMLTVDKLRQVWAQLQGAEGTYQRHGEAHWQTVAGHRTVVTRMTFVRGTLDALVACDATGKIRGYRFLLSSLVPPRARVLANGVRERPLAVSSPYGPLPGLLTLPAGKGPFPGVVLVAGSGPEDMNETIGPNQPFRDIALGLAANGVATLRYDKRTYPYARQMMSANPHFTIDDVVTDDALTALHELARQKEINPQRIFLLGHSLGALMVPRIALRDPQVDGLILLAAPATGDLLVVAERQVHYIARVEKWPTAKLKRQLAPIVEARKALAEANFVHPPSGLFFHAPASFWLSLHSYHPVATAKRLSEPLLILQGGSDYQVTLENDFVRWRAAFAHNSRVKLIEFPGLDHLFMPADNPPSPADYSKPTHMDARVIHAIGAWIRAQPER
jgi:alpha-beta hydrolase superfamily lysophospholipase